MPGIAQAILLTDLGIFESCTIPGICYFGLDLLTAKSLMPLILVSLRMNLVKKLKRKESECESLCIVGCCYTCAMAQIQRDARTQNYRFEEPPDICHKAIAAFGGVKGDAISTSAPSTQNSQSN